mgnify:CR=1 FL=1
MWRESQVISQIASVLLIAFRLSHSGSAVFASQHLPPKDLFAFGIQVVLPSLQKLAPSRLAAITISATMLDKIQVTHTAASNQSTMSVDTATVEGN